MGNVLSFMFIALPMHLGIILYNEQRGAHSRCLTTESCTYDNFGVTVKPYVQDSK